MHLSIVLANLSQYVNHFTHNVLRFLRRPLCNLYHRLIIRLTPLQFLLGDEDIVYEQVPIGNQEGKIAFHLQSSHHLVVSPANNLRDHCLLDMLLASGHHRNLYTVAIECKHRVSLCNKYRLVTSIGKERVLSVGLTDENTFGHLSS